MAGKALSIVEFQFVWLDLCFAQSLFRTAGALSAVEGIDSHLEACFCPDRGDRFGHGVRKAGKLTLCRSLDCVVSPESLPVLLRRLCESDLGGDPDVQAEGNRLAGDILMVLGISESGKFVGKEALV